MADGFIRMTGHRVMPTQARAEGGKTRVWGFRSRSCERQPPPKAPEQQQAVRVGTWPGPLPPFTAPHVSVVAGVEENGNHHSKLNTIAN